MIVSIFFQDIFMKAIQGAKLAVDCERYDINAAQETSKDMGPGTVDATCWLTQLLRLWARARVSKEKTIVSRFDVTSHFCRAEKPPQDCLTGVNLPILHYYC